MAYNLFSFLVFCGMAYNLICFLFFCGMAFNLISFLVFSEMAYCLLLEKGTYPENNHSVLYRPFKRKC